MEVYIVKYSTGSWDDYAVHIDKIFSSYDKALIYIKEKQLIIYSEIEKWTAKYTEEFGEDFLNDETITETCIKRKTTKEEDQKLADWWNFRDLLDKKYFDLPEKWEVIE